MLQRQETKWGLSGRLIKYALETENQTGTCWELIKYALETKKPNKDFLGD